MEMTVDGALVETMSDGKIRCLACEHHCMLSEGRQGICRVRFNQAGKLRVPWGYTAGIAVDPIEKKPFSHFLPGSGVLTFGMTGCNFHCEFCQNWLSAQVLRDDAIEAYPGMIRRIEPEQIVSLALDSGAAAIASSYNEPIISAEWAYDIFLLARQHGLKTVMVSNGFASREALEFLRPVMDGYKIDLKSMNPERYREMGGKLEPVLASIQTAYDLGIWVEVVTLVIPGWNDSPQELWNAASAIRAVSPDIPWHLTGFHPDYHMLDRPATSPAELQQAADIGQEAGLHYVYAGNLPGRVGPLENTYCPSCRALLVERRGYRVWQVNLAAGGMCPACHRKIAGVWENDTRND